MAKEALQQPEQEPRHRDARDPHRKGASAPLHTSLSLPASHTGRMERFPPYSHRQQVLQRESV